MTLKARVIPCLDVKDGRVVKGVQFVGLRDAGDPVEQARVYDAAGADELTFLDITASHENRDTILDVVARTAEQCFMPLTVGGGVRQVEDIRRLLLAGADKVSINSAAVARPEFVREAAEKYGDQCIVVAIDARQTAPGRWEVFTHGGRKATGLEAVGWARRMTESGAGAPRTASARTGGRAAEIAGCRAVHRIFERWYRDPRVTVAVQYTLREDPVFPTGLVTTDLTRAYPALKEWQQWGLRARERPEDPPPAKARCG